MSSTRGNRSRRVEGTSGAQSTIDRLIDIVARLLEREIRRDEHAREINNAGSEFRRLNPPTFEGGVDPIVADQWLRTIERMIEVAKVPEKGKSHLCLLYATRSGKILVGLYQTNS